jgi:glyoxylate/hydroxypyruvate reductase
MSILLIAPNRDIKPFRDHLISADPNLDVDIWPAVPDKKRVNFIVAWNQPKNTLNLFPNLKVAASLGAGADHLIEDESIPQDVVIIKLITPALLDQMSDYVEMSCYNILRNSAAYFRQRQKTIWKVLKQYTKSDLAVGIMGLGKIGGHTARRMAANGWNVHGWAKTKKQIEGVRTYKESEFSQFLMNTNIAVSMLPLTDETDQLIDLTLFKQLRHPAFLINIGRGNQLVEEDLIYALDRGILEGAVLDVFENEPLQKSHPFWNREAITITPHIAAISDPKELAAEIANNYKRMLSGLNLKNIIDRKKGY